MSTERGQGHVLHLPLVLLVLITSCQGWRTLLYPHELVRTPAVAVLMALLVLFTPQSKVNASPNARHLDLDDHFADEQARMTRGNPNPFTTV